MRKCTVKLIAFTAAAVGSFMMGLGVGYSMKKDPEMEFEDYEIKEDVDLNDEDSYSEDIKNLTLEQRRQEVKKLVDYKKMIIGLDYDQDEMNSDKDFDDDKNHILMDDGSYEEIDLDDMRMTDDGLVEIRDPYFITEEEYFETQKDFEKTPVTYYSDGIYADSRDEMINPDRFPNDCAIGFETDEIVYVRNVKISTDFEITKSDDSYYEDVLVMNFMHHNIFDDDGDDE